MPNTLIVLIFWALNEQIDSNIKFHAKNRVSVSLDVVENWKYCSKIIFKCVNNAVRPNFNLKFTEFCTCGSHEQCMGPTEKGQTH